MARRPAVRVPPLPEHVADDPDSLAECLDHLRGVREIAFDTEFVGEDSYRPDLCLVQVATRERMYLIDPFGTGPLDDFWNLLTDPKKIVIVHAGREEVRMCRAGVGKPPTTLFDLQVAAGLVGWTYPIGYAALVFDLLRIPMKKGETLTDWRRRPLSPGQVRYAFDDVRFLIPCWERLSVRLRKLQRETWAVEEFAAAVKRAVHDDPAVERWRKVKGIGTLDRKGLAVAREVVAWREATAGRLNRPPRHILRDEIVVEISKRPPTSLDALNNFRGISGRDVSAVFEAIVRGIECHPSDYPEPAERDNDPGHISLLTSLLGVVLTDWCVRNEVATTLTATQSDLRALARSRQPDGELPANYSLGSGWRSTSILPELASFLDGKRALRVADPTSRRPIRIDAPGESS